MTEVRIEEHSGKRVRVLPFVPGVSDCTGCPFGMLQCHKAACTPGLRREYGLSRESVTFRALEDTVPDVRSSDPETSNAAAGVVRAKKLSIKQRILNTLEGQELTGHELHKQTDIPLNSITPRFAELARLGKIKDTGRRIDGQIVWAKV